MRPRRALTIDTNQPLLPQLNAAFIHTHHCYQCRSTWECNNDPCKHGFSKLCEPCRRDAFEPTYQEPPPRAFDIDAAITGTLFP